MPDVLELAIAHDHVSFLRSTAPCEQVDSPRVRVPRQPNLPPDAAGLDDKQDGRYKPSTKRWVYGADDMGFKEEVRR